MATVKRLSRVARECNVGIHTIVEFLAKKGFEIENSPNSKIPEDALVLVMEAFQQDLTAKREAEKFTQEHRQEVKASLTEEEEKAEAPVKEPEIEEVLLIADTSAQANTPIPVEKAQKEPEKKEEVITHKPSKPKVVGKINLEQKKVEKPKEVKKDKASLELEKPAEKEKGTVVSETPEVKKKVSEPSKEVKEVQKPKKTEKEVKKSAPPATEPEKTEGMAVKVVGKIDIDKLNQKTRPDKKKKQPRVKEKKVKQEKPAEIAKEKEVIVSQEKPEPAAKEKPTDAKADSAPPTPSKDREVDIKTKVHKLSGPTVIGKIELPVEKPKKKTPAASSSDHPGRKKKRKRIRKDRVNVQAPGAGKKPVDTTKQKAKPFTKKRYAKPEVSEEDVQKQIKDTLARLTSKGKSKGAKHRRSKRDAVRQIATDDAVQKEMEQRIIQVTEFVTANELAILLDVPVNNIIATCMNLGLFVSINQRLDAETISLVAEEFGSEVEFISIDVLEAIEETEDKEEDLLPRPPIVTVMGHVDHGKTSFLDFVRNANVIAGEAGGITQHIGAYKVELENGNPITFLDTPGHEAFTAMRARGAQITDIVVIVVSADDSVMPQTVEAINHAAAAGVPIVFAINKIDKDGANPEKIKEELANMNYMVEAWGGKYQSHDISAKNGTGVNELLEKVLLEAELLDLKANPNKSATGSVIESSLDKGRGYITTLLVQTGELKIGDIMLAGSHFGRVKAMFNERGKSIKKIGPSEPALVLGLNGAPQAGDKFNIMVSEKEAREISSKREQLQREQEIRTQKHITLDEIGRRIAIGNFQELNIIVKGDVDGSIEALSDSLIKLSTEEIQLNVKHKAVGQISESDVLLAAASDAIIIGFQVRPSLVARKLAEQEGVDIRLYSIIYDAINELRDAMEGMLSPEIKEDINGTLEILETFKVTKVGTVAGCLVRDGKIYKTSKVRIIREGIVVYDGNLGSLKRFKDDVKEVVSGLECGLNIENFNNIKAGDFIEAYTQREIKKKL
ncbi:MAG: translation initiation factor IF-2 [Bacteroidota bacterium]|nr:translation initiation factor IF-2 [Bacteroidota bacterium]